MVRLIRLIVLMMFAFVAGVFQERQSAKAACEAAGGTLNESRFCIGAQGS